MGLRWDDDAGKSRIMCLWCECSYFRRMKGLSEDGLVVLNCIYVDSDSVTLITL